LKTYSAIAVLSVVSCLALAEIGLRIREDLRARLRSHDQTGACHSRFDSRLGWQATPNCKMELRSSSADSPTQKAYYRADERGFRLFGDVKSNHKRLLVIGDSFTQAINASSRNTYPAIIGMRTGMEIFSYGGNGYGTLQELMVLEDVLPQINPDFVLLQFCSNDFVNNDFNLESRSLLNNNRTIRPYLVDGAVVYRHASPQLPHGIHFPFKHSALMRYVFFKSVQKWPHISPSVEYMIATNSNDGDFQASLRTTRVLLQEIKRLAVDAGATLLVFSADGAGTHYGLIPAYEPYAAVAERSLRNLLEELRIPYLQGVPQAVSEAERKGEVVRADGAHWNDRGHEIVGAHLSERIGEKMDHVQ
jgi:lysophospholipase L1-like esterase